MKRQRTVAHAGTDAGAQAGGIGSDTSATDATAFEASVTLRFACFDDAPDLLRLAQLDSARPLSEPILAGEVAGRMVAALSLADGRAIADPFVLSGGVVELLRARARQLTGTGRRRWRGRWVAAGRRRVRRLPAHPL
jgi:hypothetical protein